MHEAIVPTEAPAAGPGQDLFNHLGEKQEPVKHLVIICFSKGLRSKVRLDRLTDFYAVDMFCMCLPACGPRRVLRHNP